MIEADKSRLCTFLFAIFTFDTARSKSGSADSLKTAVLFFPVSLTYNAVPALFSFIWFWLDKIEFLGGYNYFTIEHSISLSPY